MGDKHTLLDFLFNKVITYLTYLMCELECDRERGETERERERDSRQTNLGLTVLESAIACGEFVLQ